MTAAIALDSTGRLACFASREIPAWHMLGTVFKGNLTTSEMLATAHLDKWNVRLVNIEDVLDFDSYASEHYLVVRDNPFDEGQGVLGIVGGRYVVVQNEDLFAFGDEILAGGGRWETAGAIRAGTTVFGSLAFDEKTITLDPNGRSDEVNTYLMLAAAHNGTMAVTGAVTPTRVVCQNTLTVGLRTARAKFTIRHTSTVEGKIAAAREALGITFNYVDAFQKEAQELIQREITKAEFDKIVLGLYPMPEKDSKGSVKKWENKIDLIEAIYTGTADGPDTVSNITGTAWGLLNALTERVDWYGKARGGKAETLALGAAGFDINKETEKQRIHKAVLSLV